MSRPRARRVPPDTTVPADVPGSPTEGPGRHIVSREIGDTTVLLNLATGTYLAVSGSGGELWRLYATQGYDGAVDAASSRFGVPAAQIRTDLDRLLHEVTTLRARSDLQRVHRPPLPWRRALIADRRDVCAVARTAALATIVEVGLRVLPLPRLAAALGVRLAAEPEPARATPSSTVADLTAREQSDLLATERVFRYWPFDDTCLRRALVIGRQLRARGAVLHLGVADSDAVEAGGRAHEGTIVAHAWVEAGDVTLLSLPGYHRLVTAAHD